MRGRDSRPESSPTQARRPRAPPHHRSEYRELPRIDSREKLLQPSGDRVDLIDCQPELNATGSGSGMPPPRFERGTPGLGIARGQCSHVTRGSVWLDFLEMPRRHVTLSDARFGQRGSKLVACEGYGAPATARAPLPCTRPASSASERRIARRRDRRRLVGQRSGTCVSAEP